MNIQKGAAMRRISYHTPSRISQILLQIEFPAILLYAICFLISYIITWEHDPAYAIINYHPYIGYLLYPVLITLFSALLIDRLQME